MGAMALLAWDAANTYWNEWVIGYGPDLQRALLQSFGLDKDNRGERWTTLMLLAVGALIASSAALSLYLRWRHGAHGAADPAARCFAEFGRRLARARVAPRAPTEAPAVYAERAAQAVPAARAEIVGIVAAYLRARYEPDEGRAALAELRARLATFKPSRA